jgi:NADH-quinone oxidoreductase subunit J
MQQVFALFASLALVCASLVIRSNNPVHSVLFLILTFVNACGILFVVDLELFAILFLVVYVGAIAVLFLFVVMMLDQRVARSSSASTAAPLYVILYVGFVFTIVHTQFYRITHSDTDAYIWVSEPYTNIQTLASVFYTHYIGFFLISSVLLLIAMIGAIVLTMHKGSQAYLQDVSLQNRRDYKQCVAKLRQSL